ncbi:MAG: NAD(P)-dependent oxidoreductase [Bacteroidia bacterium]
MAKKIKVVLIGGNGIIGTSLVQILPSNTIELTVVSRNKPLLKSTFIKHAANGSADQLSKKLKGNFDVMIINSGYIKETVSLVGQVNNFDVNLKYVLELLALAKDKKVKKIIYTSTLAFLQKPFLKKITEQNPIAADNLYGAAKYLAESSVVSFCITNKIDHYCFRVPSPVNTSDLNLHSNVLKTWTNYAKNKKDLTIYGKGKRHQNFVNTKDITEIYNQAIQKKKKSGIYNLASPSSIDMKELAGMIAKNFKVNVVRDLTKPEDISYKNISIKKLSSAFDTSSFQSSKKVIDELLKNIK